MKVFIPVVILLGGIVALANTVFAAASHDVARFFLSGPIVLIVILALPAIALLFGQWKAFLPLLITGCILGVIAMPFQAHFNEVSLWNASEPLVKKDGGDDLTYEPRVPYDVAKAMSSRSIGDTTGDLADTVKSIPSENRWNALIIRRGVFQGYESVQTMNLPILGGSTMRDVQTCDFSEKATLRLGGLGFNNSLEQHAYRMVNAWDFTVTVNDNDAFATCENKVPMLYLPMKRLAFEGLLTHDVPAGVVIYNGKTGELKYDADFAKDGLPVYPKSIANAQREAAAISNGWWEKVMNRAGYETTSKDADDPNSANATEFALNREGGSETEWVTPLTPRGSSSSVIGLSTVQADENKNGLLNQLVINKYKNPREAPSTTEANIISNTLSGYKANGLTVFEVIPGKKGEWVATIGKNQSILYRAIINEFGEATLITADDVEDGADSPADIEEDSTGEEVTVVKPPTSTGGKNVKDMTVSELQSMADQITKELAERANAASQ